MMVNVQCVPVRTFKAFRRLTPAMAYLRGRGGQSRLHVARYGTDPRDLRFIVNTVYGDVAPVVVLTDEPRTSSEVFRPIATTTKIRGARPVVRHGEHKM